MNIQRVFALTKKELKKTIREPAVLFMIFLFPIVFVFAFGASFGGVGGSQTATYQVGVVNSIDASSVMDHRFSLTTYQTRKFYNFSIYTDNQTAQSDLSQGKIQAVILIPSRLQRQHTHPTTPPQTIQANGSTPPFHCILIKDPLVATQAVPPILQQVLSMQ